VSDSENGTNFLPLTFPLGVNTLTATPFSENSGNGEVGILNGISFEVIRSEALPIPEITGFVLINADTDTPIGALLMP